MFWLYNLLITFTSPLWVPVTVLRSRKRHLRPNWKERQGDIEVKLPAEGTRIWLHAASVGETLAAVPVVKELRKQQPNCVIFFSVTTSSGHQTATDHLVKTGLVNQLSYFPIDVLRFTLAALTRVRPDVVGIMETEIWHNFLWSAKTLGSRCVLINGRVSDRSFSRGRWVKFFYESVLPRFDRVLTQTETDAERLQFLGAHNPEVFGNTKFDEAVDGAEITREEARVRLGIPAEARVIIVGSTRGDFEQKWVVEALAQFKAETDLFIVHAPRHLETADDLHQLVKEAFGQVARRSLGEAGRYLILDTYGELGWAYRAGDIAIVGGGFDRLGGQNLIQPLAAGLPVVRGPNFQNFASAAALADREGLTRVAVTPSQIAEAVRRWLDDPTSRRAIGAKAQTLMADQQGASARYATALLSEATQSTAKRSRPAKR